MEDVVGRLFLELNRIAGPFGGPHNGGYYDYYYYYTARLGVRGDMPAELVEPVRPDFLGKNTTATTRARTRNG